MDAIIYHRLSRDSLPLERNRKHNKTAEQQGLNLQQMKICLEMVAIDTETRERRREERGGGGWGERGKKKKQKLTFGRPARSLPLYLPEKIPLPPLPTLK